MIKQFAVAVAAMSIAFSALAADPKQVAKSYELKDGSTVYIFKDGKMAMEDKQGRVFSMKEGKVMETKDGQKIMMKGNELWRLEDVLHGQHTGS